MVTHGFRAAVGPVFFGHPHLTNTATWGTLVPLSGLVLREANPLPGGMHVSIPKDTERNLKPLSLSLSLSLSPLSLSIYIYLPWKRAWQPTPVFLPGESLWTEESGGLQSMGLHRVRHN